MLKLHRSAALLFATVAVSACADRNASTPTSPLSPAVRADAISTDPATIRLGYFSKSVVVEMGKRHGFFADESLAVVDSQTSSSPVIFRKLRDRQWDVILTQIDNVFNYRYNQSNPLGGTFAPVAFLQTDWGNGASLMARPEFTTVESLRGKTVAVDSPNSGFAFVLYGIMRAHGLEKGVDYNVVVTGGTPFRYADLLAGKFDATILNSGYQFQAADAGMQTLGGISDAASPFAGGSAVALQDWLDSNPDVAVRFVRSYLRAQAYVLDPANKDEVLAWLTADAKGNASVAQHTYEVLTTAGDGLVPDGHIMKKPLYGTAALRASFGGFDTPMDLDWLVSKKSGVYDLTAWHHATDSDSTADF
ncbi:MAG TPA: ABC transporter substrate-binding protein [Gaiellaceae bacterium]|nr:ABC transporter substrate-binding protein [Gaiellaceae bacterium]